jgi:TolB protein
MSVRLPLACLALVAAGAAGAADTGSAGLADVAFVSIRTGDPQIFTRDAQGRLRAVTNGKGLYSQPSWASNNRLAFTAQVGTATRILITDEQGAAVERLTSDDRLETSPSWSPDGKAVAFYSRPLEGGAVELRLVDVASRKTTTLARDDRDMGPTPISWSADGSRIAFLAAGDQGRAHVWVMQRDGSAPRNISAKVAQRGGAWPDLSPDGRRVAWVADFRGRVPMIVTDFDSGESVELTREASAAYEAPRWSPDGRRIVFASPRDSGDIARNNDIFVMDADGSNLRNVSRHPGEDFDPRWSADGRSIVYASLRSGRSLLYEVRLDDGATSPVSEHVSHDMDHVIRRPVAASKKSF